MTSVLVADDAPSVRQLLRVILAPYYRVIEATDGSEALSLMIEHQPPLAVLDISMPGLTGLEVCRALRSDPRTQDTGVLVITANGTSDDSANAFQAGADAFLPKPFSPAAMLRAVEALETARASSP
jgi:two-component system phosphate regulon response regulator PhoB